MPAPPWKDDTLIERIPRALSPWSATSREAAFACVVLFCAPFVLPTLFLGRLRLSLGWGLVLALSYLAARWLVLALTHTRIGPARCAACDYPRPERLAPGVCPECGSDWHAHGGVNCEQRAVHPRLLALGAITSLTAALSAWFILS